MCVNLKRIRSWRGKVLKKCSELIEKRKDSKIHVFVKQSLEELDEKLQDARKIRQFLLAQNLTNNASINLKHSLLNAYH